MNNTVKIIIGAIVVFAIGFAIGGLGDKELGRVNYNWMVSFDEGIAVDNVEIIDGSGNMTLTGETNMDTLVQGGDILAISSTNTSITAAQVCNSSVINWTVPGAVTTVATTTFPGAAAMNADCLTANGDTKTFLFRNVSEAASTTQFVVASTTSDTLLMPEATGADTVVEGQASAIVTFLRTAATTVVITVTELVDGD